jgi:hypothetical protein
MLKSQHVSGQVELAPPSRLIIDSDGEASVAGAQRYLVVNPGKYSMSVDSRADSADSFRIRLICANTSNEIGNWFVLKSTSFNSQTGDFEVPADCSFLRFAVESLPNGSPSIAEFDNFKIERR